jgi:hypothetical protein
MSNIDNNPSMGNGSIGNNEGGFDIGSLLSTLGGAFTGGGFQLLSGLLGGLVGTGDSDKEKAMKDMLGKLYANEDFVKSTPFSKDELFNQIFPIIKQLNLGAADVAGSRLGAEVGESRASAGGGQNFTDYYLQALSPVMAQGQFATAEAYQGLVEFYGQMDDAAKRRLVQLLGMEVSTANQLPSTTDLQAFVTNFLQMGNSATTMMGNLGTANYMKNKQFPNQGGN